MQFTVKITKGFLEFVNQNEVDNWCFSQKDGIYTVEVKEQTRTDKQNRALHLFFTQLANELNEKGLDMRTIIRKEVEISWTPQSIKEYLWRPLQKILTGKQSTTKLDKHQEINFIYDNLNRIIIDRTKGEVVCPPFPCIEELIK